MMTIAEINESLSHLHAGIRALANAVDEAAAGFKSFNDVCLTAAEKHYLQAHARLPGSDRNARLRKKRKTVIARWFSKQLRLP